jgi:hypothetical protein
MFNVRPYRAVCKKRSKGTAYSLYTDLAASAGVDANNVFFIGPAGHELVDVTELQRIIKSGFSIVGMAVVCEIGFGWSHGESLSLPQVIDTTAIKKPACWGRSFDTACACTQPARLIAFDGIFVAL